MMFSQLIRLICTLCFIRLVAAAGTVAPSNDTLPTQNAQQVISYSLKALNAEMYSLNVFPLTAATGLGATYTSLRSITINPAFLVYVDAFNPNVSSLTSPSQDIIYLSCDQNTNTSNLDASAVTTLVANQKPSAILLYSLAQSHCVIEGSFGYDAIFTMTNVSDSQQLSTFLATHTTPTIAQVSALASSTSAGGATATGTGPTTAVAMSVLYGITGVITILFLVIIATGAIRAHRHPERYGPRGIGLSGRPRQSRAKGLARAMLETLPIVKFGDDEPTKPGTVESIELAEHTTTPKVTGAAAAKEGEHESKARVSTDVTEAATETGMGAAATTSVHSNEQDNSDTLGCSICTEDFEKGEDVRVLPCNHKYHPACVDPWLLNVSGTCPLCRIDLRPATAIAEGEEDGELAPPLEEQAAASASTDSGRLRVLRAVPHSERLAALRALRDERRQQQRDILAQRGIIDPDAEVVEEADARRRNRLTMRLRDRFGIRTSNRRESIAATGSVSGATRSGSVGGPPVRGSVGGPPASGILFGGSTGQDSLAMRMR